MKYLLVTDIPAPWREKVYEKVYNYYGDQFHVVYCNRNEKRRLWKFSLGSHKKTFLKTITISSGRLKENYLNFGIIPFLNKNRPEVVICFSMVPTVYLTVVISKMLNSKIAVFADTWIDRDGDISILQKIGRKFLFNYFPDAFIGASLQTLKWFKKYNQKIHSDSLFLSSLCADNEYFNKKLKVKKSKKKFDIMFSGRIVDRKNPMFFVDVATKVKERMGKCSALIIGDGDGKIKEKMFDVLKRNNIEYCFPGFIEHENLPHYYSQSRLFLLPTSGDCWGVVLNEAMITGLPVITTNMTAAAGELVQDRKNGFILPLQSELWAEKIAILLKNPEILKEFSESAIIYANKFNFDKAANGIISAIEYLKAK